MSEGDMPTSDAPRELDSLINYQSARPELLDALTKHARGKLENIDDLRAAAIVNKLTQRHGDDEEFPRVNPMGIPIEPRLTYREFFEELDESEKSLLDGLPESVVKALKRS